MSTALDHQPLTAQELGTGLVLERATFYSPFAVTQDSDGTRVLTCENVYAFEMKETLLKSMILQS
jgi:hypothetical protein